VETGCDEITRVFLHSSPEFGHALTFIAGMPFNDAGTVDSAIPGGLRNPYFVGAQGSSARIATNKMCA
jgi:hypothetical protein